MAKKANETSENVESPMQVSISGRGNTGKSEAARRIYEILRDLEIDSMFVDFEPKQNDDFE